MKILVIRFSSIGDIVLCSPVFRCLKNQLQADVHWLTKSTFKAINEFNPYISKTYTIKKDIGEIIEDLKSEKYDLIIDLQKNNKSIRLSWMLKCKVLRFDKINFQKWLMTNFKINLLPKKHLVDRYFESLSKINLINDGKGLEFFIDPQVKGNLKCAFDNFIVIVLGAAHATKMPPLQKWTEWIQSLLHEKIVLIGGPQETELGDQLQSKFSNHVKSMAGKLSITESSEYIRLSKYVITPDTGFMHIAAAFKKPIISIWGNTIPEFGMYPYYGDQKIPEYRLEVTGLSCRPCSKIGYPSCPKGHFHCMFQQKALPVERFQY